eukprot:TRINITY_DN470_c0_g1_i9.p1 TRINITY_DN470_c0_g1~~TRINITY_DN470_c0_g1_i9.p1  ORF type:complete len:318 (+),score=40.06 TRINITY_DN470_c0_g1_i9:569-1522(+)
MTSQAAHKVGLLAAAHTGVASLILYGTWKTVGHCERTGYRYHLSKEGKDKVLIHGDKYTMALSVLEDISTRDDKRNSTVNWCARMTDASTGITYQRNDYQLPDKHKETVKKLISLPPDQLYLQKDGGSYSIHNETVKLGDFYEVKEPSWSGYLYHLAGSLAHISATTLFGYRTAKKSFLSHADTLFKAPNIAPFMIFSYFQCCKIAIASAMLSPFFHMWPHWSRYFDPYQPNYWDNGERKWPAPPWDVVLLSHGVFFVFLIKFLVVAAMPVTVAASPMTVTWDAVFLNHGYSFVVLIPFLTVASVIVTAAASPMAVW